MRACADAEPDGLADDHADANPDGLADAAPHGGSDAGGADSVANACADFDPHGGSDFDPHCESHGEPHARADSWTCRHHDCQHCVRLHQGDLHRRVPARLPHGHSQRARARGRQGDARPDHQRRRAPPPWIRQNQLPCWTICGYQPETQPSNLFDNRTMVVYAVYRGENWHIFEPTGNLPEWRASPLSNKEPALLFLLHRWHDQV